MLRNKTSNASFIHVAILGLVAFVFPNNLIIASTSFRVEKVRGDVFYRCYYHMKWKKVEAKTPPIPEDCLMQVLPNGSIILAHIPNSNKNSPKKGTAEARIILNEPVTINLKLNSLKRITYNKKAYQIKKDGVFKNSAFTSLTYQLREAWNRLENTLTINSGDERSIPFSPFADQTESTLSNEKNSGLEMFFPQNNDIVTAERTPSEVDLLWDNKSTKAKTFRVMIWQKGEKPKQVAVVNQYTDHFSAPIQKFGSYFVQIISEDGRWKTSPHLFHVLPKESDDYDPKRQIIQQEIHLASPKKYQVYETSGPQASVVFKAARNEPSFVRELRLIIKNSKGQIIKELPFQGSAISLNFRPGTYTWQIREAQPSSKTASHLGKERTSVGTLIVRLEKDHFNLSKNLTLKNSLKESVSFYLENGL